MPASINCPVGNFIGRVMSDLTADDSLQWIKVSSKSNMRVFRSKN